METLIKMQGIPESVLNRLLEKGYFKTKTEAMRAGVMSLGEKYKILEELKEQELQSVALAIKRDEREMNAKGKRLLTLAEVKKKYRLK